MLSISNLSPQQAENYYDKDDYYSTGLDSESDRSIGPDTRWFGRGAEALGLIGEVNAVTFRQLLHGSAPDGQSLHALKIDPAKHRAGTDFTFSAPKSVSVAALIQRDPRVIEAHDRAVQTALAVMENRYVQTRQRTPQGRDRITTNNLTAALFRHETSREQDPQLHTHAVVINCTQLPNGSWRSLSNESIVSHQKLLGQIYQNELAHQLSQIGYEIEPRSQGQFELKGYSPELLATFSTRTQQIEIYIQKWSTFLEETGGTALHASQKKQATLDTRRRKQILPREVLMSAWQQQVETQGLAVPTPPTGAIELGADCTPQIAQASIEHCAEREDVFRLEQAERFALENHIGQASFGGLEQEWQKQTIVANFGQRQVTTEAAIERELHTIGLMRSGENGVMPISRQNELSQAIDWDSCTAGQREAIELAATTTDQFIAWEGVAGAGKTYSLRQFKTLAERAGYTVKGYAPSAEGANVLGQEVGMSTDTVAMLLHRHPDEPPHDQQIWVIDEAGLLNAREANALFQKAQAEQARLLLVGDTQQLSAVEAGHPFKSLQSSGIQTAFLDESLRQKTQGLKEAVQLMSQGKMDASLDRLDEVNAIREIANPEDLQQQVVADYLRLSPEEREKTLLLAGTHATRITLTQQIRAALQAENELGQDRFILHSLRSKDLTTTQAKYAHYYQVGDVILPNQDFHRQGLQKGEQYVVTSVHISVNQVTVQTGDGEKVIVNPSQFQNKTVYETAPLAIAVGDRLKWTRNDRQAGRRNGQEFRVDAISPTGIAHISSGDGTSDRVNLSGYQYADYALVSTTYSSQGKTSDRVLAVMDGRVSRESLYVAASRARYDITLYTRQLDKLRERSRDSSVNPNPSDYIPLFEQVHPNAQTPQSESYTRSTDGDALRRIATGVGSCLEQRFGAAVRRNSQPQANPSHHLESISYGLTELAGCRNRGRLGGELERTLAGLDECCQSLGAIGERLEQQAVADRGKAIARVATQYLYRQAVAGQSIESVAVGVYQLQYDGTQLSIEDRVGRLVVQVDNRGDMDNRSRSIDYRYFKQLGKQLEQESERYPDSVRQFFEMQKTQRAARQQESIGLLRGRSQDQDLEL